MTDIKVTQNHLDCWCLMGLKGVMKILDNRPNPDAGFHSEAIDIWKKYEGKITLLAEKMKLPPVPMDEQQAPVESFDKWFITGFRGFLYYFRMRLDYGPKIDPEQLKLLRREVQLLQEIVNK